MSNEFHNTKEIPQGIKETFEALTSGKYTNFVIMSVTHENKPNWCICTVNKEGKEYSIKPLFLFVDEELSQKLKDPMGETPKPL